MILLLLLLDLLVYNFTSYNSYFILLSLLLISDKEYFKIILIGLFLDLIFVNTYFINTLILLILFFINKKILKISKNDMKHYFFISNFNFILYNFFLSLIYGYNIMTFTTTFLINILFCLLSYKNVKKHIKLSRWLTWIMK